MRPILCIAGPTASGKSTLALDYVKHHAQRGLQTEIICVDSATIYKGMDIGTAKPTAADQAVCPHHLLDIRDPSQSYSAGQFATDARRLIGEIHARGAQPVLVGGTMLYFKALIDGIDELPKANHAIRAAIAAEANHLGWPNLHKVLTQVDPITAARLSPNDSQRIGRALEVYRATARPLSSYFKSTKSSAKSQFGFSFQLVALELRSRADLHERIAARFDTMLKAGLIDEVSKLKSRSNLHADLPAMRCVGYRQVWEFLDGGCTEFDMRERGIAATRQLAKRQLTWLRGWSGKYSPTQISGTNTWVIEQILGLSTHSHQA